MDKDKSPRGSLKRPTNVFYGWWVVAAGMVAEAVKHGTVVKGFSVYFIPIQTDLGLSSARYSMAQLFGRLEGGLQAPVVGYLVDRVGPRIIMAGGGVIMGLGFILLSFTSSYLQFLLVYVGLISLASRLGFSNASIPSANQWFRRKRALATSIVSAGQGLGGAAIVPLVTLMVVGLDWRTSAFISGIGILAVIVPLSLILRPSPESMGLFPDGDRAEALPVRSRAGRGYGRRSPSESAGTPAVEIPASEASGDTDFSRKEAMRTPSFWLYVLAEGLRAAVHSGIIWHLARIMVWAGACLRTAGFLIGLMSFSTLVLNPWVGWMGDKWSKQRMSAALTVAGAVALVLLYVSGELWLLIIFAVLLGLTESANPLGWAILGDFFGRKNYASLRGWVHLPVQLMSMATPVWMGLISDRNGGSYSWALAPVAILYGVSALAYWVLPRPRSPAGFLQHQQPQRPGAVL